MKAFKSFIVLVLCLAFLPAALFLPQVKAETGEAFIANGGFETLGTNGFPTGWLYANGSVGTHVSLCTENPKSGTNCIGISANTATGKYVYIYQGIKGLYGNESYDVSLFLRSESAVTVMVKLEFKTINSEGITKGCGEVSEKFNVKADNTWQKKTMTVTTPSDAYSATVLVRLQESKAKTVFADDISIFGRKRADYVPEIDAASLPVCAVKPPADGAEELFVNGDMETTDEDGEPYGWTPTDKMWTKNVRYSETYFRGESGHSISITKDQSTSGYPYAAKIVRGLLPLAEHQLSVYLKVHALSSAGFGFKYEYLNSENKCIKEDFSKRYHYITGQNWSKFSASFIPPENAVAVRIYFRLFGTGILYFDDASCYRTEAPYGLILSTDSVYYYPDAEGVRMNVELNTVSYPSLSKEDISVRLIKDGETVGEVLYLKSSEGHAEGMLPTSLFAAEKVEYQIEASTGVFTTSTSVYLYPRPERLTKDGIYMLDGKPFHPVFAYHVDPIYYGNVKEAGINVVQCAADKADLDACRTAGLGALVVLYRDMFPAGHPKNEAFVKEFVEAYRSHPAVFAWAIMDEPFSNDPGAEPYLKNAYKIIRDLDDEHPVFVMEVGDKKHIAIKYADIFGIDPYVSQNDPATYVAMKTAEAYAVSMGKPIYNLLQAFTYNGYFPTEDAMRSMLYQALWEKSKAVGYYCFDTSQGTTPLNQTTLWQVLCDWYKTESEILFGHFSENPDTLIEEYKDEAVRWRTFTYNGKLYAAVMNLSSTEVKNACITVPEPFKTESVTVCGQDAEILQSFDDKRICVELVPSGAALLLLSDEEAGSVLGFSKNLPDFSATAGKFKFFYSGKAAEIYIASYGGARELYDISILSDKVRGGVLEIPKEGNFSIKAFAFSAGTIKPIMGE